ncbi:MAG: two pore domain potassium channel family protein [Deltaproteobacteria bacterium]|nr:MAG: two pore domain potassium channel family protein [Deltaproteobacteria bacterium]
MKKKPFLKLTKKVIHFYKILFRFLTHFSFLTIAASAGALVMFNAFLFYLVELNFNQKVDSFFDCVWWAVTTTTTVGYGDITPVTIMGKIVGMFAMISGALMFAIVTGLFAQALYQDEELQNLFDD